MVPLISAALLSFISCSKSSDYSGQRSYRLRVAAAETADTRLTIGERQDGQYPILWSIDDKLAVFSTTGLRLGTAILVDGVGTGSGEFQFDADVQDGTEVMLVYPADASTLNGGTLSVQQTYNTSFPNRISTLAHAHSDAVTLGGSGVPSFVLHHDLAIVRVDISCSGLSNAKLEKLAMHCPDNAVSGSYTVNYSTLEVTGTAAADYAALGFGTAKPSVSTAVTSVYMAVIPSQAEKDWSLDIVIVNGDGKQLFFNFPFKAAMQGGKVNVIDATSLSAGDAAKPFTIHIAGDSIAAPMPLEHCSFYTYRGWGMMLHYFYDSQYVTVDNRAVSGKDTRNFRSEGYWDEMIKTVKSGDKVIISFGTNDAWLDGGNYRVSLNDYYNNLVAYIAEVRAKGAEPVLVTSLLRRHFDSSGKVIEVKSLSSHTEHMAKMRTVAAEKGVKLIDLTEMSRGWLNSLGPEISKDYWWYQRSSRYPSRTDLGNSTENGRTGERSDDIHINQCGAFEVARMISCGAFGYKGINGQLPLLNLFSREAKYREVEYDMGMIYVYSMQ